MMFVHRMTASITLSLVLLAGAGQAAAPEGGDSLAPDVTLVLVIVVDQLRADMIEDNLGTLGAGGFRRIRDHGVVYRNAYMAFSPTSTGPGHATLATGALPPVHGIPGNSWLDRSSGDKVYCVGDPGHQLLGISTKWNDGTSPAPLKAETFADVIQAAAPDSARVLALAGKDRSGILLAGHRGKAVWYVRRQHRYVSSDYYFSELPGWASTFNNEAMTNLGQAVWVLSRPAGEYHFADADDQPWERDYKGLGRVFPHRLQGTRDVGAAFRFLPQSDEAIVELAERAVVAEGLGRGPQTDVLVLALSATDYVGHAFGPDSLEWEDNLYRLDGLLSRLLTWIDRHVGLDHTMVALSSDHGIPSAPEYLSRHGEPAGRVEVPGMVAGLRDFLIDRFDLDGDPLLGSRMPGIYLNPQVFKAAGVDMTTAENSSADYLSGVEGVEMALTRASLITGHVPATVEARRVAAGYDPDRSGDLVVVQRKGWYLDQDPHYYAATHGSPYDYDAHVPMMFLAPGVHSQVVDRPVGTEDFAPTITGYLGLEPPAQAHGVALPELAMPGSASPYNSSH
jgi:predicted AlkP superfamily pyrophosphatase or phosphodiesterase